MRTNSVLSSKINMYIAACCIAAFGLVMTSYLLKKAELDDPVSTSVTSAMSATMVAMNER